MGDVKGAGTLIDLATFATALRRRGLTVTPDQVSDMARAITLVNPSKRPQVHASLRSLAITDPDQRGPFDEEFARFFEGLLDAPGGRAEESDTSSGAALKPVMRSPQGQSEDETHSQQGTSATEKIATRDFADLSDDEMAEAGEPVAIGLGQPLGEVDLPAVLLPHERDLVRVPLDHHDRVLLAGDDQVADFVGDALDLAGGAFRDVLEDEDGLWELEVGELLIRQPRFADHVDRVQIRPVTDGGGDHPRHHQHQRDDGAGGDRDARAQEAAYPPGPGGGRGAEI